MRDARRERCEEGEQRLDCWGRQGVQSVQSTHTRRSAAGHCCGSRSRGSPLRRLRPSSPSPHWCNSSASCLMSSYSVVLELFDHTAHQPTFAPSPLHPSTRTGLPPALDAELLSKQNLVLPASFWQRLPASRRLDSSASSTTRVTPPSAAPPRVWSESSGSFSPPFIATAALYTPSQAHPSQQTAKLDFRFGPLSIE